MRERATGRSSLLTIGLVILLSIPLVVVLVRFHPIPWYPILDMAMTEMRVRDVGTVHTPLIGLSGRIGTLTEHGSHPGPLSFYLLAPTYRLFGSSAWALNVACVAVHIAMVALALVIARRRAGAVFVALVAAALAVLIAGYGFTVLTEPWNPHLPVLAWVVFLLAVWSVACGDLAMLPVAVAVGTLCAQTHVPYLALTATLGTLTGAVASRHVWRMRADVETRRGSLRWCVVALALGLLLWTPPTIDQLIHTPGNYTILLEHFTSPPEPVIGVSAALPMIEERLDLVHMLGQIRHPGLLGNAVFDPPSRARGIACAMLWLVSAGIALGLRDSRLIWLHATIAVTLVTAAFAISRIFGTPWFYLMLWMWGLAVLMAIAIAWTAVVALLHAGGGVQRPRLRAAVTSILVVVAAAYTVQTTRTASTAMRPTEGNEILGPLLAQTVHALENGVPGSDGRRPFAPDPQRTRPYVMYFYDTLHMGGRAMALLNELERRGFDVRVPPARRVHAGEGRVADPKRTSTGLVFANGGFVEKFGALRGALEIARVDPRSAAEQQRYAELRAVAVDALRAANLPFVALEVDRNLFGAFVTPGVPQVAKDAMQQMLAIDSPTAVFLLPPGVRPPS